MSDLTLRERLLRRTRKTARKRFWNHVDRGSYSCPVCGGSGPFDVHHRDGDAFNNHPINLVGVCVTCHKREHGQRSRVESLAEWKDEFESLTEGP